MAQLDPKMIERFRRALQKASLRMTEQRLAILEEVLSTTEHRESDQIHQALKAKGSSASRATVYRTLDILAREKFVRRIDLGDGIARYEHREGGEHHDHLVCTVCGRIEEFFDEQIEDRQDKLAAQYGFTLSRHVHMLYGLCPDCANDAKEGGA